MAINLFQEAIKKGAQKIFNLQPKEDNSIISQDEAEKSGLFTNAIHLGGKLPEWLKGKVTEARNRVRETISTPVEPRSIEPEPYIKEQPSGLDIDKAFDAIIRHESRGVEKPVSTVVKTTGATGISQMTPIAFKQWQKEYAVDKDYAKTVSFEDLNENLSLQEQVTKESIEGISKKHGDTLGNWPTTTTKLKKYKEEIQRDFNHPIYWLAGEWVAGHDWVSKLDNKTAPGATETVRDYIKRVGDLYFEREELVRNI